MLRILFIDKSTLVSFMNFWTRFLLIIAYLFVHVKAFLLFL
nr:MAG TPA: hypothetical protein [Caudoviricetes sp.]